MATIERAVLTVDAIDRTKGCCALYELEGMNVETEEVDDDTVAYAPGRAHTAVTNTEEQEEVEAKLIKLGFQQVANWNNEGGERLNMWFRGPKGHVMKAFPRIPRAPRARPVRRPRRR